MHVIYNRFNKNAALKRYFSNTPMTALKMGKVLGFSAFYRGFVPACLMTAVINYDTIKTIVK